MKLFTLLLTLLMQQGQPPGQTPPAGTNQGTPPNNTQGTNNQGANMQGQGTQGYQMPVDGTYQVLAYEKFNQVLPGMNTIKVVIRNNVLYFPGDTKNPGKMMKLTFGPNNTVMITPLDGKTDPNVPVNTNGGIQQTNQNSTAAGNQPTQKNNVNQTGFVPPQGNSEWGVYVLSNEYFSIAVTGNQPGMPPVNTGNPPVNTGTGFPPVNITPPINGQSKAMPPAGATQPPAGGIIRDPRTGGTDAPGQPGYPPTGPGGTTQPPAGGIIRDPRTGGTDTQGQPGYPPIGPGGQGGTGVCSAVLVLRKVAN